MTIHALKRRVDAVTARRHGHGRFFFLDAGEGGLTPEQYETEAARLTEQYPDCRIIKFVDPPAVETGRDP